MLPGPQPVSFNLHSLRNICQADQCECIHLSSAGLHGTSMGTHTHTHSHPTHTHTPTPVYLFEHNCTSAVAHHSFKFILVIIDIFSPLQLAITLYSIREGQRI